MWLKKYGAGFFLFLIVLASLILMSSFVIAANDWAMLGGGAERQSWANTFVPDYSIATGYDSAGLISNLTDSSKTFTISSILTFKSGANSYFI